ncbi:MAG: HAD-IB family phosphatase [Maricaulaceae bacterium]|nr:HAD-IB family phosphatase [Maricaulaceae bacterium]
MSGARLIVFDVDSTLLAVESLDYALVQALGPAARERIDAITTRGMEGGMDFRASLMARLDMAALDRFGVARAAMALRETATPGMAELLAALRARGDAVRAVSGGFSDLIGPALKTLGFDAAGMRANRFLWDGDRVAGFDAANPLSANGGKAVVLRALKAETGAGHAVMVGDGITDLEAFEAGAADAFIGFGGVKRREAVAARAPVFADDMAALEKALLG